jgi:hypothetical protein
MGCHGIDRRLLELLPDIDCQDQPRRGRSCVTGSTASGTSEGVCRREGTGNGGDPRRVDHPVQADERVGARIDVPLLDGPMELGEPFRIGTPSRNAARRVRVEHAHAADDVTR